MIKYGRFEEPWVKKGGEENMMICPAESNKLQLELLLFKYSSCGFLLVVTKLNG